MFVPCSLHWQSIFFQLRGFRVNGSGMSSQGPCCCNRPLRLNNTWRPHSFRMLRSVELQFSTLYEKKEEGKTARAKACRAPFHHGHRPPRGRELTACTLSTFIMGTTPSRVQSWQRLSALHQASPSNTVALETKAPKCAWRGTLKPKQTLIISSNYFGKALQRLTALRRVFSQVLGSTMW